MCGRINMLRCLHIFCSETFFYFLHASSISVVPSQTTMLVHLIQSQRSNWLTATIFSAPGAWRLRGVCALSCPAPKWVTLWVQHLSGGIDGARPHTQNQMFLQTDKTSAPDWQVQVQILMFPRPSDVIRWNISEQLRPELHSLTWNYLISAERCPALM